MTIPLKYPAAMEAAIASYDYIDVANGAGYNLFYGIASELEIGGAGVASYALITNTQAYSSNPVTSNTGIGPNKIAFSLSPFNLPRLAQGTAYLSCGLGAGAGAIAKISGAIIQHVRNNVETDITALAKSGTITNDSKMMFLPMPLTPTKFKRGDILRLRITLWSSVAGAASVEIGNDPKNQAGSYIIPGTKDSTIMALHMPFKVDL